VHEKKGPGKGKEFENYGTRINACMRKVILMERGERENVYEGERY